MNPLDARRRLLGRNVYKRTTEGNPAIAQGSLARRYPSITMQGWTEQAQYEGNQLFDAGVFDGIERSGVSVSVDNGVITASGMSESAIWIRSANFTEEDLKKFKSGNIYVKNYKTSDCNYEVGIYINNVTVKEGNSPYNIPDGYLETNPHNVYFFIDIRAGVELKGSIQPIVYQDGDGTWEPYTGGAPSPSPDYPQTITSAGKYNEETQKYEYEVEISSNLIPGTYKQATQNNVVFTMDNGKVTVVGNGAGNRFILKTNSFELKPGHYTLNIAKGVPFTVFMSNEGTAGAIGNIASGRTTLEFDLTETTTVSLGVTTQAGSEKNEEFYPMLVRGSTPLPYEPYRTPQTVTLTSDRPLTKWDKLEKRNGQWGWVYKSGSYTMTGNEGFNSSGDAYHGEETSNAWIINNDMYSENDYEEIVRGYCERLRRVYNVWSIDGAVGFTYNKNQIHIRLRNSDTGVTAEDTFNDVANKIKAYVAQQYEEGNPFIFWYETTEETFVPLSESEQEQMNALYTFRPTTVLSNDCDCNMTLTYKTKKSLQPVSGGGIRKPSGVTSYFTFGVKWNQINKIVLKASGITQANHIFVCGKGAKQPWIGLNNAGVLSYLGLANGTCNLTSDDILNGQFHEIIFEFDICNSELNIVNVWDKSWSKNIVYHEIAFYNGDELLADYVPYYKGAGYMLDKKNNVVIRATNPDDYEFA